MASWTRRLDDDLGFSVVENIQDVPLHQSLLVPHVESVHVSLSHLLFIIAPKASEEGACILSEMGY